MNHQNRSHNNRDKKPDSPKIDPGILRDIITGDDPVRSAQLTVKWGKTIANDSLEVSSSQLRIIFSAIRSIEAEWMRNANESEKQHSLRRLILMKSKIRYQQARRIRQKDEAEFENLSNILVDSIGLVQNRDNFQRFVDFFEAILAYHKVAGGKN